MATKEEKNWYHISSNYLGKTTVLSPRVPKYCCIEEEGDIPRICVSNNITNCLFSVVGVDNVTGMDIFDSFTFPIKSKKEIELRLKQINKFKFVKESECLESLSFDKSYDVILYCNQLPSKDYLDLILDDLCDKVSIINFFPNKKGAFEKKSFICIKNPSVYVTKEKAYLPPKASDFRENNEHWILKPTEFKYLGKIDLGKQLEQSFHFVNKLVEKQYSYFPKEFLSRTF